MAQVGTHQHTDAIISAAAAMARAGNYPERSSTAVRSGQRRTHFIEKISLKFELIYFFI